MIYIAMGGTAALLMLALAIMFMVERSHYVDEPNGEFVHDTKPRPKVRTIMVYNSKKEVYK